MLDVKDPGIKLFGKTIPLPDSHMSVEASKISDLDNQIPDTDQQPDQLNLDKDECRESKAEIDDSCEEEPCKLISAESGDKGGEDGSQSPKKKEITDAKSEEDQVTSITSGQEKVLKKPDKVIPCPRCNSLETKFCYYNNYNVNQPRHFCKNCQRYWTAGGTMRNVPVGAGRRKNKHIASQYRHIMMSSEVVPTAHSPDSSNRQGLPCGPLSAPSRPLSGNESVLKFCPEAPLCESMTSVLNLGNQKKQAEITGGVSGECSQKLLSCGSSMMTSACREKISESAVKREQHSVSDSCNGPTPHPLPCYAGPPWVYPWNSGLNCVDPVAVNRCSSELLCRPDNGNTKQVHWGSTQMVAAPAFCTPSIPFPFVPATYWGCMQSWAAGAWNVPWVGSTGTPSPSSSTSNSGCSSNGSPTLGKHSRDVNLQGEDKSEKCLWVPKTLRIDDPDEAAKSSIWATLGIKPNENESLPKGGIFKAFQPKTEASLHVSDVTHVMHANPAALSRSQTFQEST